MKITFETLKENCVREFLQAMHDFTSPVTVKGMALARLYSLLKGGTINFRDQQKEFREEMIKMIHDVDIRAVETLRTAFPDAFPKWLKKGGYECYMEDSENNPWVLETKS